jgi:Icc protein
MLIAQISDTHFGRPGQTFWGGYEAGAPTAAVIACLNALTPRPDLVLLTGDVTEEPTPEAYAAARASFARLDLPLAAIPGNHDERSLFGETFAALGARIGQGRFLHFVLDCGPLRIVALDTVEPDLAPGGRLCAERLDWVEARLAEEREKPTLIAMHHPPLAVGMEGMDAIRCQGGESLAAIVRRHRQVVRVVCGHVHRSIHATWAGTSLSICPAVAWEIGLGPRDEGAPFHVRAAPGIHLHRIAADGSVLTHVLNPV